MRDRRRRPRFTAQARWAGVLLSLGVLAGFGAIVGVPEIESAARESILSIVWLEGAELIERRGEP